MVADVGDDPFDQPGLEADSLAQGRLLDDLPHRIRSGGGDRHGGIAEQVTEFAEPQRPVEEIGAHGEHDPDVASFVTNCRREQLQERQAFFIVLDEREDLLELVDDQGSVAPFWQIALRGSYESAPVTPQFILEARRALRSNAQKRRSQLLVGVSTGHHVGDEPLVRSGDGVGPDLGDEPGSHHRRLPDAGRPDDSNQAPHTKSVDDLTGLIGSAVEIVGVELTEGPQPLVRVSRRRVLLGFKESLQHCRVCQIVEGR